jgi:Coenzyme PQQ synthesis protein D (PqqD)
MPNSAKWFTGENVVHCELNGSVALLNTDKNIYFALDGIGPFIWPFLIEGVDIESLCIAVTSKFDVDHQTVRTDISDLIEKMSQTGLIKEVHG